MSSVVQSARGLFKFLAPAGAAMLAAAVYAGAPAAYAAGKVKAERKRRTIAVHAFAHTIRPMIATLDVDGRERNIVVNADEKPQHAIMPEAIGVERVV